MNYTGVKLQVFKYLKGDCITQLMMEKISTLGVQVYDMLNDTERGAGSFGSTGR